MGKRMEKVTVTPEEMDPVKDKIRRRQRGRTGPVPGSAGTRLAADLPKEDWLEIERLAKIRSPMTEIAARMNMNTYKLAKMIENRYGVPHAEWIDGKREYARSFLREKAWEMAIDGKHPLLTMVHLFNILPGEFKDVKQIVHTKPPSEDSAKAVELLSKLFKKIGSPGEKENKEIIQDAEYTECKAPIYNNQLIINTPTTES